MHDTPEYSLNLDNEVLAKYNLTQNQINEVLMHTQKDQWSNYQKVRTLPDVLQLRYYSDPEHFQLVGQGNIFLGQWTIELPSIRKPDETVADYFMQSFSKHYYNYRYQWEGRTRSLFNGIADALIRINVRFKWSRKFENTMVYSVGHPHDLTVAQPTYRDSLKVTGVWDDAVDRFLEKRLHPELNAQLQVWKTQAMTIAQYQPSHLKLLPRATVLFDQCSGDPADAEYYFCVAWQDNAGSDHALKLHLRARGVNLLTGQLCPKAKAILSNLE